MTTAITLKATESNSRLNVQYAADGEGKVLFVVTSPAAIQPPLVLKSDGEKLFGRIMVDGQSVELPTKRANLLDIGVRGRLERGSICVLERDLREFLIKHPRGD